MLDGILYNQLYDFWILITIISIGMYIVFEAIMLNHLLFKIQHEYKLHNQEKVEDKKHEKCLNLNNLVYDFWYMKNKFYWIITIILPTIILILNLIDIIVNKSLGIFNQGILIYTALLIYLKHKIMSEFKKYKNGRV
jgi:amino acid permease